jgi:CHAT domain-containing protein
MLLVADPVYERTDPRLAGVAQRDPPKRPDVPSLGSDPAYERLPGSAREAAIVKSHFGAEQTDLVEGFDASRERVLAAPLEQYRYIHMAVHGLTDSAIPQLSALILSAYDRNGNPIEEHLWAGDLMVRDLRAETVVFSACDTALGPDRGAEGLMGLKYITLARGARSVLTSLWPLPDRETVQLIDVFYQELLEKHQPPETSLAQAMRHAREAQADAGYWGAFTVTRAAVLN